MEKQHTHCDCCGRHISGLLPLSGNTTEVLIKTYRPIVPHLSDNQINDKIASPREREKYRLNMQILEPSFECGKCYMLNNKEYFNSRNNKVFQSSLKEFSVSE